MFQFPAAEKATTVKLPAFCLRFAMEEWVLRVNKSEINGEKAFHGDRFEIEYNDESRKYKKT